MKRKKYTLDDERYESLSLWKDQDEMKQLYQQRLKENDFSYITYRKTSTEFKGLSGALYAYICWKFNRMLYSKDSAAWHPSNQKAVWQPQKQTFNQLRQNPKYVFPALVLFLMLHSVLEYFGAFKNNNTYNDPHYNNDWWYYCVLAVMLIIIFMPYERKAKGKIRSAI